MRWRQVRCSERVGAHGSIWNRAAPDTNEPTPLQREGDIEELVNSGVVDLIDFGPYDQGNSTQFSWFNSRSAQERFY